ncbi:glutathione S-transferase [Sphingomonas sp. AR_OL41]|uniref:glutathione S-transferase n=1 Tax=Sphingomonas sp. AR_OL41 TaxID=3042729 RepID=UPI00248018B9|nr:glutathione S-transferase [Sphingomonas sp. AR_OL41]MDH7974289.1 glutathione S-transferase [Sphingomonas sp. AR_OL41]
MTADAVPILYSFRRCPYAMRARMALIAAAVPVELREVMLRSKPAAMLAASPKATVPVLVLADGSVIDESLAIMRWALARNDPEGWRAGDDAALIAGFDGAFKQDLDRYKYPERHAAEPIAHRDAGLALLDTLERRLAVHVNLSRDARALSDIAIMPFVRQFAAVDRDWFDAQAVPRVRAWLARHVASPLFDRAMLRVAAWRPGDVPIMLA